MSLLFTVVVLFAAGDALFSCWWPGGCSVLSGAALYWWRDLLCPPVAALSVMLATVVPSTKAHLLPPFAPRAVTRTKLTKAPSASSGFLFFFAFLNL